MEIKYNNEVKANVVKGEIVWKGLDLNETIIENLATTQIETTDDDMDIIVSVEPSLTQKLIYLESIGFEVSK